MAVPHVMTRPPGPSQLPHNAQRVWTRLDGLSGPVSLFDPAMVRRLPEPGRRWLTHAIQPDTPLLGTARLTMHGQIRLGTWWRFEATQLLRPPHGFVWAATARKRPGAGAGSATPPRAA